uniref:Uncharacterized protein n=1 Tax=Tanacetum cinerariifolium TaxID=118510 RepID=A0A6L2JK12_TANCI|nr:hypothetical protein [Tanacetum cinerariifolium]
MKRFKNAIFKKREEINDRMVEMFGLLKELTASRTPNKVLIKEETRHPTTKNINSISLIHTEEEKSVENNRATDKSMAKPSKSDEQKPPKEVDKPNEGGRRDDDELAKGARDNVIKNEKEQPPGVSSFYAIGYYLKHRIDEKLIEGLVENQRFNDSLSATRVGKMKQKTYDLLPNIREDEKRPFILGTPFLTTAKAVIKFDKGMITLKFTKSKISFHMIPKPHCRIEKGIKNEIEPIASMMTVNRLVLEWEEKIKLHQEKEMKFDQ